MRKVFATHAEYQEATMRLGGKGDQIGAKWTTMEEAQLRARLHQGMNIFSIAHLHGRTPSGIVHRLKMLGLIEYDGAKEQWVVIEPSATIIDWKTDPYVPPLVAGTNIGTAPSNAYLMASNTVTNPTFKESNTMTKPLEHKAFLFGNDITKLAENNIISYIKQANEEINSYASIPDNNYTKLRIANLKDAIEAAVKELNKRGE
jgi:hypothetical protein